MSKLVVGVTGGIGSGKTAVSDQFQTLGIDIVDADIASRVVVEPGQPALAAIAAHFGAEAINPDGSMNRALVRQRVFADPAERQWLEQLTHPLINAYLEDALRAADSAYVILVSPLLFETGQDRLCHRVLVVDVPEELQVTRTMQRDNNEEAQVRAIIAAQTGRDARLARADDVIVNDQGLDHVARQVARLHRDYLALSEATADQSPDRRSSGSDGA